MFFEQGDFGLKRENIAVTRSSMPPFDDYVKAIESIWDSCWLSNYGQRYEKLKRVLCDYLSVPGMVLFANGHLALESALLAFDLSGEVITTPFTFASTTHAIVRCGLTPVFCDIDEKTYCMDPNQIESLITPRTTAIVPVHVYGAFCDTEKIQGIADKHGLKVIYDGAHAFGASKDGKSVGQFGDATMLSFHATKVFHTIEGGAVTFSDENIEPILRGLQNFGYSDADEVSVVGGNAKMNEFQAAMGLCNLKYINHAMAKRAKLIERYRERLADCRGLVLPAIQENVKSNSAYFPVCFDKAVYGCSRDEVFSRLAECGVHARKYFYPLTSSFECYKGKFAIQPTPVAEKIAASVLALPLYEDLSEHEVDYICSIVVGGRRAGASS